MIFVRTRPGPSHSHLVSRVKPEAPPIRSWQHCSWADHLQHVLIASRGPDALPSIVVGAAFTTHLNATDDVIMIHANALHLVVPIPEAESIRNDHSVLLDIEPNHG